MSEPESLRRRRPRLGLSLRALMVLIALLAVPLAWHVRVRDQRRVADEVRRVGGRVVYDHEYGFDPAIGPHSMQGFEPKGPRLLRRLLGDDFFGTITYVDLAGSRQVNRRTLEALAGLDDLVGLDLTRTGLDDEALAPLADLRGLKFLSLRETRISDAGLRHLAGMDLDDLNLTRTRVGSDGLAHLAGMRRLRRLELVRTKVGTAGLAHLAGLGELRELWLGDTSVRDAGLAHLVGLRHLRLLDLTRTDVGDAGCEILARMEALENLMLNETLVGDAGCEGLARLDLLESLDLSGTRVTDAGVSRLASLSNLEKLYLRFTAVSDAALATLANQRQLREVDLRMTDVSDDAIPMLQGLDRLDRLYVEDTRITAAGARRLRGQITNVDWRPHAGAVEEDAAETESDAPVVCP